MMTHPPRLIVGLTGGIGSGKSAVTKRFSDLGVGIVDTDEMAHSLTAAGGLAIPTIRNTFGTQFITPEGALDRQMMRKRVFELPEARLRLESILHPMIRQLSDTHCAQAPGAYVVVAVPLLVESGAERVRYSRICVVDCPEELQVMRVRARSGLDEQQIRAIIATQATREARLAVADDVIDNTGTLDSLHRQVDALHLKYLELTRQRLEESGSTHRPES